MSDQARVVLYTVLITILCVFGARFSLAADYSVRFGPSIQDGSTNGSSKAMGVRAESHEVRGIYNAVELGGYVDNGGEGRKGAAVAKAQLGVKPGQTSGVYGFAFTGPCLITATDSVLSTNFQFATDVGVGIRDSETFVSVGYSHISNAGIKLPNRGRDFILFSLGVSL